MFGLFLFQHSYLWNLYSNDEQERLLARQSAFFVHVDVSLIENYLKKAFILDQNYGSRLALAVFRANRTNQRWK